MKTSILRSGAFLLLSASAFAPRAMAAQGHTSCADLAAMKLPDTTITAAEEVTGGSLTPRGERALSGLPAWS